MKKKAAAVGAEKVKRRAASATVSNPASVYSGIHRRRTWSFGADLKRFTASLHLFSYTHTHTHTHSDLCGTSGPACGRESSASFPSSSTHTGYAYGLCVTDSEELLTCMHVRSL